MSDVINVKQHDEQPQKGWSDKQWLEHAWIHSHNPWITEDDRQYWRDKITELTPKVYE